MCFRRCSGSINQLMLSCLLLVVLGYKRGSHINHRCGPRRGCVGDAVQISIRAGASVPSPATAAGASLTPRPSPAPALCFPAEHFLGCRASRSPRPSSARLLHAGIRPARSLSSPSSPPPLCPVGARGPTFYPAGVGHPPEAGPRALPAAGAPRRRPLARSRGGGSGGRALLL